MLLSFAEPRAVDLFLTCKAQMDVQGINVLMDTSVREKIASLCVVLAMLSSIYLFSRSGKYSRLKLPPGPRGLPLLGSLLQLGTHPHRATASMFKQYGHLIYLRLGVIDAVFVDSPELVALVTKDQDPVFCSRPSTTFTKLVAWDSHDFAMAPYGTHWRYMRRICVHELLTPKRLENTADDRNKEVSYMIRAIAEDTENRKVVDVREHVTNLTMNVIRRMVVGGVDSTLGEHLEEYNHLIHETFRLMGVLPLGDYVPFLSWLDPNGYIRDMRKLRRNLDKVYDTIIQEYRDLATGKRPGGKPSTFVSVLLDLPGENGEPHLDVKTIKAVLNDMMAAATDTSAVTIEWAMAESIKNPDIQQKLQDELDSVVGLERLVQPSDLSKLPYLMCVIKESFRLHPAACFSVPRESLADTKIAGYDIPKGTRLIINIHSLGRNADVWADPLKFDPSRMADSNLSVIDDDRLYVFGYGRRKCPGYNLGSFMVIYTLARLFQAFSWSLPPGVTADNMDLAEEYGFTSPMRTRMRATARPRLAPHLYT